MLSWWKDLFSVESRESQIEGAVYNLVNHVINNPADFTALEQVEILSEAQARVQDILTREAEVLSQELNQYKKALQIS